MKKYIFLLGTTPKLSNAEVRSVFVGEDFEELTENALQMTYDGEFDAEKVMSCLGGTVKILEVRDELPKESTAEQLQTFLVGKLVDSGEAKIKLAVSEIGRNHLKSLDGIGIKRELIARGVKVRYIDGPRTGISAAILIHQKTVQEWYFVETKTKIVLAKTLVAQNIDEWTHRDRMKPYSDRRKGMLPPKLARIMVNLALGRRIWDEDNQDLVLYDPFCGSGTVLMETAFYDLSLAGSDLDVKAVLGTGENMDWLQAEYDLEVKTKLLTQDVSQVRPDALPDKVDFLVTEPFLGKPTPKQSELAGIFRGLEKLYLGAFKNWTRLLRPGATLVVVLPTVKTDIRAHHLHGFLDKINALGYTRQSGDGFLYHRPNAVVQREIHVLRFK
ncbi:MAG: hypothetical protein LBG64_00490 [Pseudomonadales bacterium]|jgi:tRNA G10  N-methylase Trm11|nr:hypothetical protein [Pseudomonadales bacterium]